MFKAGGGSGTVTTMIMMTMMGCECCVALRIRNVYRFMNFYEFLGLIDGSVCQVLFFILLRLFR